MPGDAFKEEAANLWFILSENANDDTKTDAWFEARIEAVLREFYRRGERDGSAPASGTRHPLDM